MSMRDRLRAVLDAVQPKLKGIQVDGMSPDHSPLLEVSAALVRGAFHHCQSILALADAQSWGGIGTVERAAWEMWNELDYLLRSKDPTSAAVKVQANAVLEIVDLLEKTDDAPAGMLERNREFRDRLEARYPGPFAKIRAQRTGKKKKWHWSGLSRTAVVGPDEASSRVYKLLSWESHPDIVSLRDIEVAFEENRARVCFGDEGDLSAAIERSCRSSAELLLRSWNLFAQFWGLDVVVGLAGWNEDA